MVLWTVRSGSCFFFESLIRIRLFSRVRSGSGFICSIIKSGFFRGSDPVFMEGWERNLFFLEGRIRNYFHEGRIRILLFPKPVFLKVGYGSRYSYGSDLDPVKSKFARYDKTGRRQSLIPSVMPPPPFKTRYLD